MGSEPVKVVMNWSSGKDAAMAFHLLRGDRNVRVTRLLTTLSAEYERVFMHGVREELLDQQAARMGLPLVKVKLPASPSDDLYKDAMRDTMQGLKAGGVTAAAFGDIFLEDLRKYREQQLAQVDMQALFPLWKMDTHALVTMVEDAGIDAIIVCVNDKYLGNEFLGQRIGRTFLEQLPEGVDPCGENGEYHTFVRNAPFFSAPIEVSLGATVHRRYARAGSGGQWDSGFYFLDVIPG